MMNRKMVKIICIILAGLMLLSAVAVLMQVFAADEQSVMAAVVTPDTGDGLSDYIIPAGIAVAAVLGLVICIVLPKMKKKEPNETEAE